MRDPAEPRLSLTEWVVLCVAAEQPTHHGFALAAQLGRGSALGAIWYVARQQVYRSLERLARLGLIREAGREHSSTGPVRQLSEITPAGRELAGAWLGRPARHGRDVRSELLVKLALLDRAGANASDLVRAQRDELAPIAGGLEERLRSAEGSERTVMLWRREAISATLRFLDALEG
jgi:DNA-binding PadR family transcriptional regulator